jgi:hypothetical protein
VTATNQCGLGAVGWVETPLRGRFSSGSVGGIVFEFLQAAFVGRDMLLLRLGMEARAFPTSPPMAPSVLRSRQSIQFNSV